MEGIRASRFTRDATSRNTVFRGEKGSSLEPGSVNPWSVASVGLKFSVALWLALFGWGCASSSGPRLSEESEVARALLEEGRLAERNGETERAEELYRQAIKAAPRGVPAHRRLQNLLLSQCRRSEVFRSYRESLGAEPDHPAWHYLYGRLHVDADVREEHFVRARRVNSSFDFAHYGLGYNDEVRRDYDAAFEHYRRALDLSPDEPLFLLRAAVCLHKLGRLPEALATYRRILSLDPHDSEAALGLVSIYRDQGERDRALEALERALALDPTAGRCHTVLRDFAEKEATTEQRRILLEAIEGHVASGFEGGHLWWSLGVLSETLGRLSESVFHLRQAAGRFSNPGVVAVELRRLLVGLGRHREAWKAYEKKIPGIVLAASDNRVAPRYSNVANLVEERVPDPNPSFDSIADLVTLGNAYAALGWLEEARSTFSSARALDNESQAIRDALAKVVQQQRFLGRLRRVVLDSYGAYQRGGDALSLDEMVDALHEIAGEELEIDREELGFVSHAPLGRFWMSSLEPESALGRRLDALNLHLIVGRRIGGPSEISVVTRSSHRPSARVELLGLPVEYDEIVTAEILIPSFQVHSGTSLAGVALDRNVLLDLDSIWNWVVDSVGRARLWEKISRGSTESGLFSADGKGEALELIETLCLPERLFADSGLHRDSLEAGFGLLFEHVRLHECGHVVDSMRYLPLTSHPFRALGLFVGRGFSAREVEAFLEGDAELMALAESSLPRLGLGLTVGNAFGPLETSVHARGYRAVLEAMVERIYEEEEEFPEIDRGMNVLQQLHKLPAAKIQRLARELARKRFNLPR